MKVKTYLINLKDSTERRERAMEEISRYPFMDIEWVEAVNGKKLTEEETARLFNRKKFCSRYHREPLPGEIGCTLSHKECYRRLLCSENEYALILEDDVCFLSPEDVEYVFKRVIGLLPLEEECIITFTRHMIYYPKNSSRIGTYTLYRLWSAYGTCAYLVNKQAARRLLSIERPFLVANDFEYMAKHGILVQGIYPSLALDTSTMRLISSEIIEEDRSSIIWRRKPTFWEYLKGKYRVLKFWLGLLAKQEVERGQPTTKEYLKGKYRGVLFRLGILAKREVENGQYV